MTIYEVAGRVRLHPSSISRIERGEQRSTPTTAARLAKALGITEAKVLYPERFKRKSRAKAKTKK